MYKQLEKIVCSLFLLFTLLACQREEVLSNPVTIKGMKLGLDFEEQMKIGKSNGLCINELVSSHYCQYNITSDIYAKPELFYGIYKDKKVLGQVKLILNSPSNFPSLTDISSNELIEYPSITRSQLDNVISMFNIKYGKGKKSTIGYGESIEWTEGDLYIRLNFSQSLYTYIPIHPQIKWAFEKNAFATEILYEYVETKKKLLKSEATYDGEVIGDKI